VKEENRGKPYRESPATAGASGSSGASDCWREATARWSHAAFPSSTAEAAGEQAFNAHSKRWAPQRTPPFLPLGGGGGHTTGDSLSSVRSALTGEYGRWRTGRHNVDVTENWRGRQLGNDHVT
jgi:hypothetical protein